jgi:hypothetical protein
MGDSFLLSSSCDNQPHKPLDHIIKQDWCRSLALVGHFSACEGRRVAVGRQELSIAALGRRGAVCSLITFACAIRGPGGRSLPGGKGTFFGNLPAMKAVSATTPLRTPRHRRTAS